MYETATYNRFTIKEPGDDAPDFFHYWLTASLIVPVQPFADVE
jgi:hypothetical protein